jgi:hypothetical protein
MSNSEVPFSTEISNQDIDIQIKTAHSYPRDISNSVKESMSVISSFEGVAENCFYILPRGRSNIEGASIRLAEIAISSWGNIHAATRVVGNDGKFVVAEAVVWDLEKNLKIGQQCKRSIIDSRGNKYSENMIQTTAAAAQSIAFRNAVFKVLPRCIIDSLLAHAKDVVKTGIKSKPKQIQQSKVNEAVNKLLSMNINEDQLLKWVNVKSLSEINSDHFDTICGFGRAIKEGHLNPNEEVVYAAPEDITSLKSMAKDYGIQEEDLCEAVGVNSLDELTEEKLEQCAGIVEGYSK